MAIDPADVERIDRERRKREERLILLLLLLADDARKDVVTAIKHDFDFNTVISNVMKDAAAKISGVMVDSYYDGFTRAARLADEPIPRGDGRTAWLADNAGSKGELLQSFSPAGQDAADAIVKRLQEAVTDRDTDLPLKESVNEAFSTAGYMVHNNYAVAAGAERAVVGAHNNGIFAAGGYLDAKILGLTHISVLDDRTTEICRERNGLTLPIRDEYWTWNMPPLHWGCRSIVMPVTAEFSPSDWRPTTPPAAGFGEMSATFLWRNA